MEKARNVNKLSSMQMQQTFTQMGMHEGRIFLTPEMRLISCSSLEWLLLEASISSRYLLCFSLIIEIA